MRFKTMLAAVAAAAALAATPAFAETVNSGYVGVSAANFDADSSDYQDYSLTGAVAFPFTGSWGAQVDGAYSYLDSDNSNEEALSATGHVFHRTPDHLIGGFIGASDSNDVTTYGGGVEGDLYRGDWTIGGRVAYVTDDSSVDVDTWSAEGRAKYFYTDNVMVSASLGFAQTSVDLPGADDFNTVGVGVGAEYRFEASPVSVFGGVNYTDVEDSDDVTGVQIGVRLNWADGSLRDRDRSGASLQGIQSDLAGVF